MAGLLGLLCLPTNPLCLACWLLCITAPQCCAAFTSSLSAHAPCASAGPHQAPRTGWPTGGRQGDAVHHRLGRGSSAIGGKWRWMEADAGGSGGGHGGAGCWRNRGSVGCTGQGGCNNQPGRGAHVGGDCGASFMQGKKGGPPAPSEGAPGVTTTGQAGRCGPQAHAGGVPAGEEERFGSWRRENFGTHPQQHMSPPDLPQHPRNWGHRGRTRRHPVTYSAAASPMGHCGQDACEKCVLSNGTA